MEYVYTYMIVPICMHLHTADTIEQNVEEGYRKVGQANQELNTAVRLKVRTCTYMCCFIC